jgi:hypothetical protein
MWSVKIPSIAFEFPYVYSAMLGVAALHLLTLKPEDAPLEAAAYYYMDVSTHREEIARLDAGNSQALLANSMLITLHAKLRSRCLSTNTSPYVPNLDIFHLQRGVEHLMNATKSIIGVSPIHEFLEITPEPDYKTYIPSRSPQFRISDDTPFQLTTEDPKISPERQEIYHQTLSYFSPIKEALQTGGEPEWIQRRLAAMPNMAPEGLVALLEERDPLALAILARHYALMKFVDAPWWLKGIPEYEVKGLAGLMPKGWEWAMEWPLGILKACERERQRV